MNNPFPPATLNAFRDHGVAGSRLKEGQEEAHQVLKNLAKLGIDLESITRDLEKTGVESFNDSYKKIIEAIKVVSG